LKVYQIVMKGDERSEEYARISRESFESAIAEGVLPDITTYDAVTPEREDFEEHVNLYKWESSLMVGDLLGSNPDDHSPTEKAGMCSHWDLLRIAAESDERVLVLEHDTVLLPEHFGVFAELIEHIEREDTLYANIGLFMGCYSIHPHTARWMYDILTEGDFPINCGPYCTLQRLFRTYTTDWLKKNNYMDLPAGKETCIHPYHGCDTLWFGRRVQVPFNEHDSDPVNNKWKTPTTQVVSKRLMVTQDHHGYQQSHINEPWTRHNYMKVID